MIDNVCVSFIRVGVYNKSRVTSAFIGHNISDQNQLINFSDYSGKVKTRVDREQLNRGSYHISCVAPSIFT